MKQEAVGPWNRVAKDNNQEAVGHQPRGRRSKTSMAQMHFSFGKLQIYLHFQALIRTFAVKMYKTTTLSGK
jgi:hypothetical protein